MDWSLALDIAQWAIRLVMIPVVAREHRAQVALAWLGVILLAPLLGLPLYLLFGEFNLRRRVKGHAKVRDEVEALERLREEAPDLLRPDFRREVQNLARLTGHLAGEFGAFPVVDGNTVELIGGQQDGIDRIIEEIDRAEHHVHLLFFLFNGDATGRRVAAALARAVERGVRCRLLVDAMGSGIIAKPSFFRDMNDWLAERGVEVRSTLPVRMVRRPLARMDIRNHRKIVVVDGRVGYTGSLNVHDRDFGLEEGEWEQMMVRLEGPAVGQLQLLFVEDWRFSSGDLLSGGEYFPPPREAGEVAVQVVPGGPTYKIDLLDHLLVATLHSARQRVAITTPYFVPDQPLMMALRLAALGGAEVHLILPEKSDRLLADAAGRTYLAPLLAAGVHVYLFPGGFLHCKSMSVDGEVAIVGSANYDRRSLYLNYEANLVVFDPAFTAALEERQNGFLRRSRELSPDWWDHQPRRRQFTDHMAKLLSPLL